MNKTESIEKAISNALVKKPDGDVYLKGRPSASAEKPFAASLQKAMATVKPPVADKPELSPQQLGQWAQQIMLDRQQRMVSLMTGDDDSESMRPSYLMSYIKAAMAGKGDTALAQTPTTEKIASEVEITEPPTGKEADFADIIREASDRYQIPESLIREVIRAESAFNPKAVSHAGAQGLMQLMPATAKMLGVDDSFDPKQNIMGGAKYLRMMLNRFDNNLSKSLAAYNWGPHRVDKGRTNMPEETTNYVNVILRRLGFSQAG